MHVSNYFSTAVGVRMMHVNRFAVATYSIMGDAFLKIILGPLSRFAQCIEEMHF